MEGLNSNNGGFNKRLVKTSEQRQTVVNTGTNRSFYCKHEFKFALVRP